MEIKNFKELRHAVGTAEKRTVAVACAHDEHTLEAVLKAHQENILDYILVGKEAEIIEKGKILGEDISKENIVNCETDEECAEVAVRLVNEGKADFAEGVDADGNIA